MDSTIVKHAMGPYQMRKQAIASTLGSLDCFPVRSCPEQPAGVRKTSGINEGSSVSVPYLKATRTSNRTSSTEIVTTTSSTGDNSLSHNYESLIDFSWHANDLLERIPQCPQEFHITGSFEEMAGRSAEVLFWYCTIYLFVNV